MDDRLKVFPNLLPAESGKLLMKEIQEEDEITYERIDINKSVHKGKLRNPNSAAAIKKRKWRQQKVIVDGKEMTNRDIEREKDRIRKFLLRNRKLTELADTKKQDVPHPTSSLEGKENEEAGPVLLPDINALTGYASPFETIGEYNIHRKLKIYIQEIRKHSIKHKRNERRDLSYTDIVSLNNKGKLQRETTE